jgi:hypothetical protein
MIGFPQRAVSLSKFEHKDHRSISWIPCWWCSSLPVLPDVLSTAAPMVVVSAPPLVPNLIKNVLQCTWRVIKKILSGYFLALFLSLISIMSSIVNLNLISYHNMGSCQSLCWTPPQSLRRLCLACWVSSIGGCNDRCNSCVPPACSRGCSRGLFCYTW